VRAARLAGLALCGGDRGIVRRMQPHEVGSDIEARLAASLERLLALIERFRDRLAPRDADFARESAEQHEWEMAIEVLNQASRRRLLLTTAEKKELAEIEASLRPLAPEMTWRSIRRLARGLFSTRRTRLSRSPAVEKSDEPAAAGFDAPLLADAMPTVAARLRESLRAEGEQALAEQVDTSRVHALCSCGEDYCFSFYLAPPIPVPERQARWTGLAPHGFESVGIDNGQLVWVQDEFRGPAEGLTEEGRRAIREYQSLIGVVLREEN